MRAPRRHQAVFARHSQSGLAAIEFALLAPVFFLMVFAVIEFARYMYIVNTVQESTRRAASAASLVSHRDTDALARIRQAAVFRSNPGELPFGDPVTDRSVRISYLALIRDSGGSLSLSPIAESSLPLCPRENRRVCMNNPNAPNCIRFVQAQICADDASSECNPVRYSMLVPLFQLAVDIPRATTINVVESLGSMPEGTPCL